MADRIVRFGIVGGGLMGREFASAAARWVHLADIGVRPEIAVVCDVNPDVLAWYGRLAPRPRLVTDYAALLADESVEAVYCAVPHHLHEELYTAVLQAGKHLLGEKPFGIDLAANEAIMAEVAAHPELLVRCSSEFPFYPGGQEVFRFIRERRYHRVLEVRSQFLHSSDLDPEKPINWKRRTEFNGDYGRLGDLRAPPPCPRLLRGRRCHGAERALSPNRYGVGHTNSSCHPPCRSRQCESRPSRPDP